MLPPVGDIPQSGKPAISLKKSKTMVAVNDQ